jgi:uncharacterized protein YkwD
MPWTRRIAAAAAALALLTASVAAAVNTATAGAAACAGSNVMPAASTTGAAQAATLCLINEARASHGVAALRPNRRLRQAALGHDRDMVSQNFFDHTSPSGSTPIARVRATGYLAGARGYAIGENIGWATGSYATPAAMVQAWMNSPEHRANILDPSYHDSGIGVLASVPALAGGGPGAIYTQDFGGRQ